jgi:GNAT superfamily N-acetyltransferase
MDIRRIRAHECAPLRALRLRALADAPTAFGTTLEEEERHPQDYWEHRAQEGAAADTSVTFVAEDAGCWVGMARGFLHREDAAIVRLASMWVDPRCRRCGVGGALVEAVIQWARGRGATQLQLWVTDANGPARSLYTRCGFALTGRTKPLPSRPTIREALMARPLA